MGLSVMTNELALTAQRNLEKAQQQLHGTIQRLSTGRRIVQASDDPAGLALSDNLNAQVRSLGQAIRNAQDGISLVQVYEGGSNEINNMLVRVRELAMQSASDTLGDRERRLLDNEVQQLKQEIDRISRTTKYGGRELLSGNGVQLEFQVGVNNEPEVDRITFNPGDTNLTSSALGVDGVEVGTKDGAQDALNVVDQALDQVNDVRARVGAVQNRLNTTMNAQGIFQENLMAAKSRIVDADMGVETSNLARQSILRQAGVAVLAQANQTPALALQLLRQ